MKLSSSELEILAFLEKDIPLVKNPYKDLAQRLGVTEEEVVNEVKKLIGRKIVRRIGAIVKHTSVGFTSNAMVAWKLSHDQVEKIISIIKNEKRVTHAYLRRTYPGKWEYNFYTMIHAKSEEELSNVIKTMEERVKCKDYIVLNTVKEFKKISPIYIEGRLLK